MSGLKRDLGLFSATMLVVGNIIGVGIFLTPGDIAALVPSSGWLLIAWAIGGFLSAAGALTYAELGTAYPLAGGNYVFLRKAYGPLTAFLFGWAFVMVTSTGTIALLSIGFAKQLGFPKDSIENQLLALAAVLLLSYLNYLGVKLGAGVTNLITFSKIVAMAALIGFGFAIGDGNPENFHHALPAPTADIWKGVLVALVPMSFAYSGWNATIFVSEEVQNPSRNIPLSLIGGTLLTAVIYVAMNVIYLYAIPVDKMPLSSSVAGDTAGILFGETPGRMIRFLIAFSALGCLSASIITNPRTLLAMSRDKLFFSFGEKINDKYGTPSGAIIFQGVWSCVLILVFGGSFNKILAYLDVPLVIFSCLTVAALFVLRVRQPDLPRPYKCWGYPVVPFLYVVISIFMLISTVEDRGLQNVVIDLSICALGVPVYYLWKTFHRNTEIGPG